MRWPKWAAAKRPTKPPIEKPLIALSQRPRVAANDELPAFNDAAVFVNGEGAGPERFPCAPGKDAKVVGIFEILGKHDVAFIEHHGQL